MWRSRTSSLSKSWSYQDQAHFISIDVLAKWQNKPWDCFLLTRWKCLKGACCFPADKLAQWCDMFMNTMVWLKIPKTRYQSVVSVHSCSPLSRVFPAVFWAAGFGGCAEPVCSTFCRVGLFWDLSYSFVLSCECSFDKIYSHHLLEHFTTVGNQMIYWKFFFYSERQSQLESDHESLMLVPAGGILRFLNHHNTGVSKTQYSSVLYVWLQPGLQCWFVLLFLSF